MTILVLANAIAVIVAVWAIWELGLTNFASRYDSPKTKTLVLFMLGAVLDSPARSFAEMSYSLTGRDYVLTFLGHICYLAAACSGVKYIYLRLLPEPLISEFLRTRTVPALATSVAIMGATFLASPRTAVLTGDHFYLVHPDGWLTIYWSTFYLTLTGLLLTAMFGVNRLRTDPRSVALNVLLTSLGLGVLSVIGSAWGLLTASSAEARLYAWPLTYAAIAVGAMAVVIAWRHRVRAMLEFGAD